MLVFLILFNASFQELIFPLKLDFVCVCVCFVLCCVTGQQFLDCLKSHTTSCLFLQIIDQEKHLLNLCVYMCLFFSLCVWERWGLSFLIGNSLFSSFLYCDSIILVHLKSIYMVPFLRISFHCQPGDIKQFNFCIVFNYSIKSHKKQNLTPSLQE